MKTVIDVQALYDSNPVTPSPESRLHQLEDEIDALLKSNSFEQTGLETCTSTRTKKVYYTRGDVELVSVVSECGGKCLLTINDHGRGRIDDVHTHVEETYADYTSTVLT